MQLNFEAGKVLLAVLAASVIAPVHASQGGAAGSRAVVVKPAFNAAAFSNHRGGTERASGTPAPVRIVGQSGTVAPTFNAAAASSRRANSMPPQKSQSAPPPARVVGQRGTVTPTFNRAAGAGRRTDSAQQLSLQRGPRPPLELQNANRSMTAQQAAIRGQRQHIQALQGARKPTP